MKCVACSKELNKKELLYSEDKHPYCVNPFTCNEGHPNSVPNILARGAAVKMFTEDELEENLFDKLDVSEEMKERIIKAASKPQSIRLSKLEIAYYLIALQEQERFASISEAVRFCVNLAMRAHPIAPTQPKGEPTHTPAPAPVVPVQSEGIKFVVPDMPKSINVDWSKVEPTPMPIKEAEDEEEFTF